MSAERPAFWVGKPAVLEGMVPLGPTAGRTLQVSSTLDAAASLENQFEDLGAAHPGNEADGLDVMSLPLAQGTPGRSRPTIVQELDIPHWPGTAVWSTPRSDGGIRKP